MNRNALLAGLGAGLLLAGSAQAAGCGAEIMAMQQRIDNMPTMASNQALPDDRPTARIVEANRADTKATAAAGAAPLPAREGPLAEPGTSLGAPPSAVAGGSAERAHAIPSGAGEAATAPAPIEERDAAGGILVQRESATPQPTVPPPDPIEPMDSDQIQATDTPAGVLDPAADAAPTVTHPVEAAQDLARAQAFYQAGDETACLSAIEDAKRALGQP
jgi:hypothetical protein